MSIAYQAGHYLRLHELRIAANDAGFAMGVTVTDQCRTCGGKPFRLENHLDRFAQSCAICQVACPLPREELRAVLFEVLARNQHAAPEVAEWSLVWCVTPGLIGSYLGEPGGLMDAVPRLIAYAFPLNTARFERELIEGAEVRIARSITAPSDFTVLAKQRSRLHWYLAEREVKAKSPQAHALLLNADGCLTETASCNLLLVCDGVLLSPKTGTILPGITLQVVKEMGLPLEERALREEDIATAEAAILTSTPFGVMPVRVLEGRMLEVGHEVVGRVRREARLACID